MRLPASPRAWIGAALIIAPLTTAHALIKFNDARDEIFVTGTVGMSYDSNIFGFNSGDGDTSYNASLDLEYTRKAGLLGVNAGLGWRFAKFQEFTAEDFANPYARVELTKDSGRTTGSVTAGVKRDSSADAAINIRTTSWDYDAGLNVKYPVIERYSLTGQLAWDHRDFQDNFALVDLNTWSLGSDLFYVYNSQRDLFGGYRLRVTDTTNDTQDIDHNFSVGTSGKIISTINGSARVGYQFRESSRANGLRENFDGFSAAVSASWSGLKRFNLTGRVTSDFNTIATDTSVQTTATGLDAQYAINARFSAFAGTGVGYTRFLGISGNGRRDTYFTWNTGLAYTLSDRFKATLSYVYFKNWSTLAFSDYERNTISLNLSSRW
jgi:outer membrane receptor protein involved in Fe transport